MQGTHYFIPLEVEYQRYWFAWGEAQAPLQLPDSGLGKLSTKPTFGRQRQALDARDPKAKRPAGKPLVSNPSHNFRHNPIHDFDALWWLAVYLFLTRRVSDGTPADLDQISLEQWVMDIFADPCARIRAFCDMAVFETGVSTAHEFLEFTATTLERARRALIAAYFKAEEKVYTEHHADMEGVVSLTKKLSALFGAAVRDCEDSGSGDFMLTELSVSFVNVPDARNVPLHPASLDTALDAAAPRKGEKRKRLLLMPDDEGEDDDEDDLPGITAGMSALSSPTRRGGSSKRLKRDPSVEEEVGAATTGSTVVQDEGSSTASEGNSAESDENRPDEDSLLPAPVVAGKSQRQLEKSRAV